MKAAAGEGGTEKRGLGRKGGKATRPLYKCPGSSLRRRQDDMPRTGWVEGSKRRGKEIGCMPLPPKKYA